ncbi:helix-turn-helix transcriptional regulator [Chengkuizengella axinellae]|uniref:Helix-turn-helix transcriptional regulator n=1 Tax=Chengkuizengella axinellae TaxID=3064388 RepID=A0ABT9J0C9_9BACL|nr:helix-turn-helix transcriptional regulator [Chengkuizengella sp. 2205SS18-9]MDP5275071.1 helix-turn-helix transcriptional regulator [Chengkuizengella sp. 2205SS18-9]
MNKPRHRFIELRKKSGKTQKIVALEMGVTETTIRAYERGRSRPNLDHLFAFARYFDTNVYELWPDIAYPEE